MDLKAFDKLSYGLYVVSAKNGEETAACVVNTLAQATVMPARVVVTINKQNCTEQVIERSGRFEAVVLCQSAMMELIGAFGFCSSRDGDKFAKWSHAEDSHGIPYLTEQVAARFECRVIDKMDAGSHVVFLAEVEEAQTMGAEGPMTYAYYHGVRKGLTPPKASSYQPAPAKGYRCRICGYILESDTLPDDFVCPICGRGKEFLERIEPETEGGAQQ